MIISDTVWAMHLDVLRGAACDVLEDMNRKLDHKGWPDDHTKMKACELGVMLVNSITIIDSLRKEDRNGE